MLWLLLDIVLGVFALLVLGTGAFLLYGRVKALLRSLRQLDAQVDAALAGVHDAQVSVRGERLPTT